MRWWWIALVSCVPTPTPPVARIAISAPSPSMDAAASTYEHPRLSPEGRAPCVVNSQGGRLAGDMPLRFRGKTFAVVRAVGALTLHLGERSTATVTMREAELVGEIEPRELALVPRQALVVEGWLEVHRLRPRHATGAVIDAEVTTPRFVATAAPPEMRVPCAELDAVDPEVTHEVAGEWITLRAGISVPARAQRSGPVVATIRVPADVEPEARSVMVVARDGKQAQVRIEGDDSTATLWTDAAVFDKVPPMGTGYGQPGRPLSRWRLRCAASSTIFVRTAHEVVAVGQVRPDVDIPVQTDPAAGSEIFVRLGAHVDTDLEPFIRKEYSPSCVARRNP